MANPWLVKAGAEAVKNPERTGKVVKGVIVFIVSFFVFISAISSSFISLIVDVGNLNRNNDLVDSKNVKAVEKAYDNYMEETLYPEMERIRSELEAELNPPPVATAEPTATQESSSTENSSEASAAETAPSATAEPVEEEKIEVNLKQNEINLSYALAYLTHISDDFKAGKGYVNKSEVEEFFASINVIREKKVSDTEYMVYNAFATPEEAAQIHFTDDTIKWYLLSFDLYVEFLGSEGISIDGLKGEDDELLAEELYQVPDTGLAIPKMYQNDYRKVKYGNGTIATSGCAPTCIAMVTSYLTGSTVTPDTIVAYTGNKYYISGAGSSWAVFPACANAWGYTCTSLGKNMKSVIEELSEGNPVIVSVGSGTFTKEGHIMVIRGTEDGCFLINDPNKNNTAKYQTDKFAISTVMKEAKSFWSFS